MMTSRRTFLAGTAAALAASSAPAWGQVAPPTRVKVIDVHSHWYPPEWLELVEKEAVDNGAQKIERNVRGQMVISIPGLGVTFQPQYTDIPSRLKAMDEKGVAIHVMSLTQPMVYWAKPEFGLRLSQAFNNACSELHKKYPERFLGLAMLPMQSPEMSLAELDRVARLPGIKGAYMSTHVLGKNLDDKSFWPVYEKCEALGMPIFLHPTNTLGADRLRNYYLRNFIGNPVETSIAAASLMFSGVMDKYPKLEVVLPHAGGVFPSLLGRMTHGQTVRQEVKDLPRAPMEYRRRFHYDTIAHDKDTLLNLVHQVGADRVVCGTDYPADMSDVAPVTSVEKMTELSTKDRDLILRGNAARLLKLEG